MGNEGKEQILEYKKEKGEGKDILSDLNFLYKWTHLHPLHWAILLNSCLQHRTLMV